MASKKRSKNTLKGKPRKSRTKNPEPQIGSPALTRLEFHRHGLALVPDENDPDPGIAFFVKTRPHVLDHFWCTCEVTGTCRHLHELEALAKRHRNGERSHSDYNAFIQSVWYRLAVVLAADSSETPESVKAVQGRADQDPPLSIVDDRGSLMVAFLAETSELARFKERLGIAPKPWLEYSRSHAFDSLSSMVCSENERQLNNAGAVTRRQDLERNFWYRFAYHAFREFAVDDIIISTLIDQHNGDFCIMGQSAQEQDLFRAVIPKQSVRKILTDVLPRFTTQNTVTIHPTPLKPHYGLRMISANKLEVSPRISFSPSNSNKKDFDIGDMTKFVYGSLVYLHEFEVLVELEKPNRAAPITTNERTVITGSNIPHFLVKFRSWNEKTQCQIDDQAENLEVYREQLNLRITPAMLEREWYWLSFDYSFGMSTLSLSDILDARRKRLRFINVENGWVDCDAPHFREAEKIVDRLKQEDSVKDASKLKLTRLELLRLSALAGSGVEVNGKKQHAALLKKFVNLQPRRPMPSLSNLVTPLRQYQEHGVNWLRYLWENRLGGLLCDDMGLGKTHQIMALIAILKNQHKCLGPTLVVCPTTVISHWCEKLRQHAPVLRVSVHHGSERSVDSSIEKNDVIVTSYGVLRNDVYEFKAMSFALAIFDEAQYLKNQQTLAHAAAQELDAAVKIGLTGTPIENSALELKALFDVVLPGYLGSDHDFERRYATGLLLSANMSATQDLRKIISPFVLRRLKQTVLDELPDKIEDTRGCLLSEEQVKLYREAVSTRGGTLQSTLEAGIEAIPYIHIFALLTLLKQICDHPAVSIGKVDDYERYTSGKWELFKELLSEALESGQKIVIFSQFLDMIRIIEKYLTLQKVGFVTLTGATRKRGKIISQFNTDDRCRVFLGSLMAGGTGIDLVAGSVVIHYDRWWNAAREDQATDRLHRIGQKRVVQVFKLVTKGTLEEKIAAIIDRKKRLMENVIQEDDPNLLKTLSREDLIDLIAAPFETSELSEASVR